MILFIKINCCNRLKTVFTERNKGHNLGKSVNVSARKLQVATGGQAELEELNELIVETFLGLNIRVVHEF